VTRDYELGFILNPEVSEEVIRPLLERIQQIVVSHDGQVVKVNQWGRRRLAYPIEHNRDGYYIFIDMILTPETVAEIEHMLQVSEVVLRHMVKRRDPKAVQKEREERAEREARAASAAAAAAEAAAAEAETLPSSTEAPVEVPAVESEVEAEAAPQAEAGAEQQPTEQTPAEEASTDNASSTADEPSKSSIEA
jgi:small subunit ribosomal protein S6